MVSLSHWRRCGDLWFRRYCCQTGGVDKPARVFSDTEVWLWLWLWLWSLQLVFFALMLDRVLLSCNQTVSGIGRLSALVTNGIPPL